MTDKSMERELGEISANVRTLMGQSSEMFTRINELKAEVGSLKATGCAQGKRNADDITELKSRPGRIIELGACIVAILAAAIAWIKGG